MSDTLSVGTTPVSVPQVEVEAEYFIYLEEENVKARFDVYDGTEWPFGRACNRVVRWSAEVERIKERRAKSQLDAALANCDQDESELEPDWEVFEKFEEARGDLFRHYDRVKVMIQQLVDLATLSRALFTYGGEGAFEDDCLHPERWLRPSMTLYKCLPPESWPDHPGVPPFVLLSGHRFSPIPIEGWNLYSGCKPEHPRLFKFRVPQSFVDEGGWHSLKFPASQGGKT